MNIDAPKYSEVSKADAFRLMDLLRDRITLPVYAIKETRFNNNDHVLWILESQSTETQFTEEPVVHVTAALIEAAKSDHWYKYEKKYDDDYEYYSEVDNNDNFVEE